MVLNRDLEVALMKDKVHASRLVSALKNVVIIPPELSGATVI